MEEWKLQWEKKNVGKYHAAIFRCGLAGKEKLLMLDDTGYLTLPETDGAAFPYALGEEW